MRKTILYIGAIFYITVISSCDIPKHRQVYKVLCYPQDSQLPILMGTFENCRIDFAGKLDCWNRITSNSSVLAQASMKCVAKTEELP